MNIKLTMQKLQDQNVNEISEKQIALYFNRELTVPKTKQCHLPQKDSAQLLVYCALLIYAQCHFSVSYPTS